MGKQIKLFKGGWALKGTEEFLEKPIFLCREKVVGNLWREFVLEEKKLDGEEFKFLKGKRK